MSRRRSPPLPQRHGHHKRPQSSTMAGGRGRFKCYAPAILGHARRCRAPQGLRIGCVGLPWAAVAPSTAIFYTNFTLIFLGEGSSSAVTQNRNKRLFWPPLGGEIGPPECPWAGGRQHGRPVAARYRLGRPLPPPRPPPASRTLARGDFPRISGSRDSSCPRARPAGRPAEARSSHRWRRRCLLCRAGSAASGHRAGAASARKSRPQSCRNGP